MRLTDIIEFEDNRYLLELVGPQGVFLTRIAESLGVTLSLRGNQIAVRGDVNDSISLAKRVLEVLYKDIVSGKIIDFETIDAALRSPDRKETRIVTKKKTIFSRSPTQVEYIDSLSTKDMVFGIGPAGTGKTYLAVALGVSSLIKGEVDRIILSRPAVEAGERLGFLPGDVREKVDPYLRPLYDALNDMLPSDLVEKKISTGEIEIAPLAYMRGRTLSHSFVILDEAQNATPVQLKMFLTRLGYGSKMIITGDITQIDLPHGRMSGLEEVLNILKHLDDISIIYFDETDVVRHPLVGKIIAAYQKSL